MRAHERKRRILLHDSDFRGKFRIVRHFSCRNAVFHLFHTPEPAFPTLPRDYGGVRCRTIPKTAEKWNRATFTGHGTCRSGRKHATTARKTHPGRLPFFPYILMRFIREEPRVPETSPISMKLVMFCWAISTQSSTTQLLRNCSGSDCST